MNLAFADQVACESQVLPKDNPEKLVKDVMKLLCDKDPCAEYEVDQPRVLCSFPHIKEKNRRVITRVGDKTYDIEIPLNIKLSRAFKTIDQDLGEKGVETLINLCLKDFSTLFESEIGLKLNIRVNSDKSQFAKRRHRIKISDTKRSHFKNINYKLLMHQCGPVVHEMLHILGLVDEYPEPNYLYGRGRARGPQNSLMSEPHHHRSAWSIRIEWELEGIICLPKKSEIADLNFDEVKSKYSELCQQENSRGVTEKEISTKSKVDRIVQHYQKKSREKGQIFFYKIIEPEARLYPAHFRQILYPNCNKRNETYLKCARYAYSFNKYENLPKKCKAYSWLD